MCFFLNSILTIWTEPTKTRYVRLKDLTLPSVLFTWNTFSNLFSHWYHLGWHLKVSIAHMFPIDLPFSGWTYPFDFTSIYTSECNWLTDYTFIYKLGFVLPSGITLVFGFRVHFCRACFISVSYYFCLRVTGRGRKKG